VFCVSPESSSLPIVTIDAVTGTATRRVYEGMPPLPELQKRRAQACRLTPDRALQTLDEAAGFLRERGLLTLLPDCSLPSLFGACHEEPYAPGKRGFASWPRTKWWWGGALASRPGVYHVKIHRGKGVFLSEETAAIVDPLCRAELDRVAAGKLGPDAQRLVAHLDEAGPSAIEELKTELGLDTKTLRTLRKRLEPVGAVVSRDLRVPAKGGGHRHTSELLRWDQLLPRPPRNADGGLAKLLVAGVRAAVVAPEREVKTWFSWTLEPELIERLVADGQLRRPEPGSLAQG
jgi:hypothetical protein